MRVEDRALFERALDVLSNQGLAKTAADEDAELEAFIDTLSPEEAQELLEAFGPSEEQRESEAREAIAKAQADRAREAIGIAKSAPEPTAAQVARLAEQLERNEIVGRQKRVLGEMRDRPKHATSYMYAPVGNVQETAGRTADAVLRLRAADPGASRPRWAW